MLAMAVGTAALVGMLCTFPRCPECGFVLSVRNGVDPSLRNCRRCRTVFRTGESR
jgi:hypothetical protein